ncbi:ABC transporter [Nakamurella sp. YIM 132087]|uniref:ABC transporter n=1 Tax=Nakamurella alba TaxID=2665158 RepID=A0A7K1FS56_9ACTN|nr:ABC transporter [Nakamurella alba]MTD16199.1 ABC transporter [Nakamurella alba]
MKRLAAAVLLGVAVAGCGATVDDASPVGTGDDHGFVAGASEVQDQQRSLLGISGAGAVTLVDLATEDVTTLGAIGPVDGIADDGRFVLAARTGGPTAVIDSGLWTTDHGDHVHYYRSTPRITGELDLTGTPTIHSTENRTAVAAGGDAVLLDRDRLGQGEITVLATAAADPDGMVAPLDADRWVVTADDELHVLRADGTIETSSPCGDPHGGIVTRVGVVAGCAEGALLVPVTEGTAVIESIPYPTGTARSVRATDFAGRSGRPTVAAVAPDAGIWLLDTRERSWQLVPTKETPLLVSAIDDSAGHVVGVMKDGTVAVWDSTGTELGRTSVTAGPVDATLRLTVDADRAYIRSTTGVLEIDYRDAARIARTLDVAGAVHVAEVGL